MKTMIHAAEITVSYQPKTGWNKQPTIKSSQDAYRVLKEFYDDQTIGLTESFWVLYLSYSNQVKGAYHLSSGGLTGTVADIRLILGTGLKVMASGIILSHNHPSGNLKPSSIDRELTGRIANAAKLMDMKLLDHLILSPAEVQYNSFTDKGDL